MKISEIALLFASVGGILLFVGLFVWLNIARKKRLARCLKEAALRGWQVVEPISSPLLYHFKSGAQNISWEIYARSAVNRQAGSVSSSQGASTHWISPAINLPNDILLVAPIPKGSSFPPLSQGGWIQSYVIPFVLKIFLGEDPQVDAPIEVVSMEGLNFQKNIGAFSSNPTAARSLLEGKFGDLIAQWNMEQPEKYKTAVIFWKNGLQLRFGNAIEDFLILDKIVHFGESLLQSLEKYSNFS